MILAVGAWGCDADESGSAANYRPPWGFLRWALELVGSTVDGL